MARLILVRHGESEGNRDRRFTQNAEVPLTDLGREQARVAGVRIADRFAPVEVVASPYRRAHQTGEIIAAALRLPLSFEPDLREQSFGVLAGQPYNILMSDAFQHDGPRWEWRPPEGESLVDVYQRATPALDRLARRFAGRDVVVVSHGGVMSALVAYVAGDWQRSHVPQNCGIIVVTHGAEGYSDPVVVA